MGNPRSITVPLELPGDEAMALGTVLRRLSYELVIALTDPVVYDGRAEHDCAWSARAMLLAQLKEAGFGPQGAK